MPLRWLLARHMGSPPLTRERRLQVASQLCNGGITPAYAGKTGEKVSEIDIFKDHPRLRGKDVAENTQYAQTLGSPPLTRERRIGKFLESQKPRITPAYAGKTISKRQRHHNN